MLLFKDAEGCMNSVHPSRKSVKLEKGVNLGEDSLKKLKRSNTLYGSKTWMNSWRSV